MYVAIILNRKVAPPGNIVHTHISGDFERAKRWCEANIGATLTAEIHELDLDSLVCSGDKQPSIAWQNVEDGDC